MVTANTITGDTSIEGRNTLDFSGDNAGKASDDLAAGKYVAGSSGEADAKALVSKHKDTVSKYKDTITGSTDTPVEVDKPVVVETPDSTPKSTPIDYGFSEALEKHEKEKKEKKYGFGEALEKDEKEEKYGFGEALAAGGTGTTDRDPKVDYDSVLGQAQDIKDEEIQQALKQEAIDQQNIRNAFSHLLAQGKDSGFINAKNMASIRNAALSRGDAVTAANMKFSNEAMSIAKEKAISDASFDRELYMAEAETWSNTITSMLESGDIENAVALAESLKEEFPQFVPVLNPAFQSYYQKQKDENIAAQYIQIRKDIIDLAMNPGEGQQLNESRGDIIRKLGTDKDMGAGFIMDYFGTIPEEEYEDFLIDEDDAQIIKDLEEGKRGFDDLAVQEVFLDAYIADKQRASRMDRAKETFGPIYSKYEGDDVSAALLDAVIEDDMGRDGTIQVGEDFITVYDDAITLDNIESAFKFDAILTDWDGDAYHPEFNSRKESADEPVDGLENFTNQELDRLYNNYHDKMKKQYSSLPAGEQKAFRDALMNQASFKENLLSLKDDGMNKQQMMNGIYDMTAEGKGIAGDSFTGEGGKEYKYSDYGVDIDKFKTDENDVKLINDIIEGNFPTMLLMEELDEKDPELFQNMANKGVFLRDDSLDPSNSEDLTIKDGIAGADYNTNMFTGTGMTPLLEKLDDNNEAIVYIGGAPHFVKATSGYRKVKGRKNIPVINWSVQAFGKDDEGNRSEPYEFQGQITNTDGVGETHSDSGGYARDVLKEKSLNVDASKYKFQH
ncbi:hypothetical protein QUF61_17500 [Candidatus Venteria ishoeyi]|uniref:hypothetical protein n=1 Tax=Candidatus Venteria ishoeyi TaxID=1899563 RepID=UPI0025A6387E|nr:hypothetical protein [Candidatus Venteria ishoeyi]MDM8548290.1 hypothetical protein [Candidatus Venteria ishoeyi]